MRQPRAWVQRDPRTPPETHHPRDQRWRVIYEDPDTRKRRTKGGFGTKAEAEAWRNDFITDASQGKWIGPEQGAIPFREFALRWHTSRSFDKANTRNGYRRIIEGERSLLNERFGGTPLSDISHEAIAQWIKEISARRSATTVRNNFYVLKKVLDYAVRCRRLAFNPCIDVDNLPSVKKSRHVEEDRYPLTPSEIMRISAALPEPWDVYTRLVAFSGMRPEEAAGLRLCDVDGQNALLKVRGVIVDLHGEQIREDKAKNDHSRREIDLDPETAQRLTRYMTQHRKRAAVWFGNHPEHTHPGEDLPLFVGMDPIGRGLYRTDKRTDLERLDFSKPMRHKVFYARHWKATLKTVGLPDHVRFYDLRHAGASLLLDRVGQPDALTLKEIQERYGWSSAAMLLDRYGHAGRPDRDRKRSAIATAWATDEAQSNVTQLHA